MESYDPRKPIIKATDDETDEVHGHSLIDPEQEPVEATDLETNVEEVIDPEVEGHIRHFR